MTLEELKVERQGTSEEVQLAAAIRQSLPRQAAHGHAQRAAAEFGLLMSGREIHERIRSVLPQRGEWKAGAFVVAALLLSVGIGLLTWGFMFDTARCTASKEMNCPGVRAILFMFGGLATVVSFLVPPVNRKIRTAQWMDVLRYEAPIPDAALLKYGRAMRSELFSGFWVVEPAYQEKNISVSDPWLIGRVKGTESNRWIGTDDSRSYVVLAYWE